MTDNVLTAAHENDPETATSFLPQFQENSTSK